MQSTTGNTEEATFLVAKYICLEQQTLAWKKKSNANNHYFHSTSLDARKDRVVFKPSWSFQDLNEINLKLWKSFLSGIYAITT